ncbi:hypothetical protein L0Y34_02265 [Candidatus Parcubacteria bacterium]|nr:hypothetical protein [Candidatus Parcubacteria bacterium]
MTDQKTLGERIAKALAEPNYAAEARELLDEHRRLRAEYVEAGLRPFGELATLIAAALAPSE